MSLASFVRRALRGHDAEQHTASLEDDILLEKERMHRNALAAESHLQELRQTAQIIQSSSRLMNTMSGMLEINRRGGRD